MLTPSEVIEKARRLHPSFDTQRHPNTVLAEELDAWQRNILEKVQRVYSEELRLTETIDLPLATFTSGYTLPDHSGVFEGLAYWNEDQWPRQPFSLEPEANRHDPAAWPSGYLRGNTLHLMGREEDWTRFDRIELPYVPTPSEIDLSSNDTSILPDSALQAARFHLVEFMAGRHHGDGPEPDVRYFMSRSESAEEDFIDGMQLRATAQVGKVRDVRRQRR